MTDHNYAELIAFAAASTRPAGKCLGFANNDVVKHFGVLGELPVSAKAAADQLANHGQLHTGDCPSTPHVDFYDFVSKGVNLGHVDWHFPQHGDHVADSSRITAKLNHAGTVGTYANWGTRRGWALVPALNAQISFVNDPTPPSAPAGPANIHQLALDVIAGKYGNGPARKTALGSNYDAVQAEVNAILGGAHPAARTYTVQPGDSLSSIATRLRIGGGWRVLYAKNRAVVGGNPNVLHAGQVLVLP